MSELGNHLWQSTLFAVGVAVACLALRNNKARVRYWLWLAASAKFLIPFSLLVSLGGRLVVPASPSVLTAVRVEQITTSFAPVPVIAATATAAAPQTRWWTAALVAVWLGGALLLAGRWMRRWSVLYAIRRRANPVPLDYPIPVALSSAAIEPGVFGLFRPVLLLPEGLASNLAPEQLEAILAHELCHVRWRDNLTAAVHIAVATAFWFHPAVWWIGRRLIEERERACDEAVLGQGSRPEAYAQGILKICQFYVQSPLPCASGVTGADLKKRIREIMTQRVSYRLTLVRKLVLAAAGLTAVSVPVVIGVLRAQTLPPPPAYGYEVVSIRPSAPGEQGSSFSPGPQGGMRGENITTMQLLTFGYDVRDYQFEGAPGWVRTERYNVTYTPDKAEVTPTPGMGRDKAEAFFHRQQQRMQAVLRDRFALVLRAETRELPIYALTIAKGGHKLKTPENGGKGPNMRTSRGEISAQAAYLNMLTNSLASLLGRYVRNETGLDGPYDFKLQWTPDVSIQPPAGPDEAVHSDAPGVSIFTAVAEQLGLRLEAKKGPVPVFVVEKIEKPSAN